MRLRLFYILSSLFLSLFAIEELHAQIVYKMSVNVVDPSNSTFIYNRYEDEITVYSFINKKDAEDALAGLKKDNKSATKVKYASTHPNHIGEFKIEMYDSKDATLLVWCNDLAFGYEMLNIRQCRNDLIIELSKKRVGNGNNSNGYWEKKYDEETGDSINVFNNAIEITEKQTKYTEKPSDSVEEEGTLTSRNTYVIPYKMESNMRVVVQPLWYDRIDFSDEKSDSVFSYGNAFFYDKFDYNVTQDRRMDYDIMHDKLYSMTLPDSMRYYVLEDTIRRYSRIEFTEGHDTIIAHVVDTLSGYDPNPSHPYPFGAIIKVFDYNVPVYSTDRKDDGERRNPLKFIDFTFKEFLPDDDKFFERQEDVRIDKDEELHLNFEVGKSTIVANDSTNMKQLNKLRDTFIAIRENEKRSLVKVEVYGMASPDGSEEKNKSLAKERAAYVQREIKRYTNRPVEIKDSRVAGWDCLADSLARDGYVNEAKEVKDIVEKFPNNMMAQGYRVAALPYYKSIIKDIYLPKLRTVRFKYTENYEGQKSIDKILEDYNNNANSLFKRGEFWSLFKHIKDKKELEGVVRHALKVTRDTDTENSKYCDGYWPYAAALLACCYIARDTIDMQLLEPFLDYTLNADGTIKIIRAIKRDGDGNAAPIVNYVNWPEFAANQLIMTLKQHKRSYKNKIPILEGIMNKACTGTTPYDTLMSFSKCLRGGYKAGKVSTEEEAEKIRRVVSSTSVTNRVVINLAMDTPEDADVKYLNMAMADTLNLPDNPVSDYLKSIIYFRKGDKTEAETCLARCFEKDITKIAVASNDKDLISNAGDGYRVIENAINIWKNRMSDVIMHPAMDNKPDTVMVASSDTAMVASSDTAMVALPDSTLLAQPDSLPFTPSKPSLVVDEKHPYTWYIRALESIKKSGNNNYEDAKSALFKCFDIDKRYVNVLVVSLKRDISIRNNEEIVEKLKGLLSEYKKKSKK